MSGSEVLRQEPQFAALVGIDWADQKHAWCLQAAGTTQRESGEVEHTPEAVEAWVGQLCQRFGNRPIAVAVEQVKGALVFMLSKYEPLHWFPVPPAMSAKMRAALYPSGAKDGPRDADLLVDPLLQHRDKLRRLSPDSEATRRVQNLVEEKTAQSNRLTNHLKIYFPQMLEWFDRLDTELVCALLEQWPTLEELQKVPAACGVWLAAGALRQCRGSASLQWDCAGDGTEWEKEVGPFSLGLSEVFAAELSRVGGAFHCSLAMGAKLLSTAAGAGQGAPRGGARFGLQMDSHRFPLLERWSRL